MDSFLDANVIINYTNFQEGKCSEIVSKSYFYIINKKDKFIVCYSVIRELYNAITKLSIIHREVLKKIEEQEHSLLDNLPKKDISFAEKLYVAYIGTDKKKLEEIFSSERDRFEIEIERFLKTDVNEKVIPLEQIDNQLANRICDIIQNHADSRILASALQYQKDREIFLFVTADGKHFNPNSYQFLQEQFEINPLEEKYKFPELLNLIFA